MKKLLSALLAAGLLTAALGGCNPRDKGSAEDDANPVSGALAKAGQVELLDGDGNVLRTLTTEEEVDPLFQALDSADWDIVDAEEGSGERSAVELTAVFSQRPTQTVLGPEVQDGDREEVLRLTVYEGSSTAELKVLAFTFRVDLPDSALEALRTAAGLPDTPGSAA